MTAPLCVDPAEAIINTVITTMKAVFTPTSSCPPVGGGSTLVHFVPGEGVPWDPLEQGDDCDPFLWVRLISRYRSQAFPAPDVFVSPCAGVDTVNLEVGVGRCVDTNAEINWSINAQEAEWGLDDSWRLDRLVCVLSTELENTALVAAEQIIPYGPDGGGIAWSVNIYVGITS